MFSGIIRDTEVTPIDVPTGSEVKCVECGSRIETLPAYHNDFTTPRRFDHPDGDCGHSLDTDATQVSVAASEFSMTLDTDISPLHESPDVNCDAVFDTSAERFGDGVLLFIVSDIDGKYVRPITQRVTDAGYSAVWVPQSAYSEHNLRVDFDEMIVCPYWATDVPKVEKWTTPMWTPTFEFGGTPMLTPWEYEIVGSFPVEWFPETVAEAVEDKPAPEQSIPRPQQDIPDRSIANPCAEGEHSIVSDPQTPIGWICEDCGCSVQGLTDHHRQTVHIQ
jgi:hypothetical protein